MAFSLPITSLQQPTPIGQSFRQTNRRHVVMMARPVSSKGDVESHHAGIVGQCLGALLVLSIQGCCIVGNGYATGLERIDTAPVAVDTSTRKQSKVLRAAEEEFQNSEFLKTLKERSELHREERQRELRDTYCKRQAELGVGDCAGLRLIPGATKSGVQKTPEWITKLLGNE